jgi:hypothetical protein
MKKLLCYILVPFALILNSCNCENRYHTGTFSSEPVNIQTINSEYDDYNSDIGILGGSSPLCFSSNRTSLGKDFDIVYMLFEVIMTKSDGKLFIGENTDSRGDGYAANYNLLEAAAKVKTQYDELGPYLIPQGNGYLRNATGYYSFQKYIMMYASNESGNLDIKFIENITSKNYSNSKNVVFLNSGKDDAYPTLKSDTTAFYFCSNRETSFDIYRMDFLKKTSMLAVLTDSTPKPVIKDVILSSDQDDKCPYIIGNLMVFTSNRAGGFGGFDLYYSIFNGVKWSEPVNFGDKINTKYDEYRPIVKDYRYDFTNFLMIFSSNRPGGKGGYDLYYVGIEKMTK